MLASQRQDGVRPHLHGAVDAAGEVHAQEREGRVGDRVDQRAHERGGLVAEPVVLAAERDDPHLRAGPGQAGHPVAVQAGAVDDQAGPAGSAARMQGDGLADLDGLQGGAGAHVGGQVRCDAPGHGGEVHRRRLGDVQRGESPGVRLPLTQLVAVEAPQAADAVEAAAPLQLLEPGDLFGGGGDDDLAAVAERESLIPAELRHGAMAAYAQLRPQRAGRVVDARVQDSAVVAGLVGGRLGLLLDDRQGQTGQPGGDRPRRGQAHDPRADHDHVVAVGHAAPACCTPGRTIAAPR